MRDVARPVSVALIGRGSTHPLLMSEYVGIILAMPQAELVPVCRELGIGFLAYSPLGRGQLTGMLNMANLSAGDFRNHSPRFSKDAMAKVSCSSSCHNLAVSSMRMFVCPFRVENS